MPTLCPKCYNCVSGYCSPQGASAIIRQDRYQPKRQVLDGIRTDPGTRFLQRTIRPRIGQKIFGYIALASSSATRPGDPTHCPDCISYSPAMWNKPRQAGLRWPECESHVRVISPLS